MRAREFITEISRPDDRWKANTILNQAGWDTIGSGSFASVYGRDDKPYVLKLFDHDDAAYLAFARLTQEHPNVHFPRLRGRPIRVSGAYYAIRMEKLEPYRGDPDLFRVYALNRDYEAPEGSRTSDQMSDVEEIFYGKPSLRDALDIMIDHLTPEFRFDLQPWNLMMRGREVVFTDPVCLQYTNQERHIVPVTHRIPKPVPKPPSKRLMDIMSDDELMRELDA